MRRNVWLLSCVLSVCTLALPAAGSQGPRAVRPAQVAAEAVPPAPWAPQDPADSVYRGARRALSTGDYERAAALFHSIPQKYPRSAYAPDALYWEAFALYRRGGSENLRVALARLDQQRTRYPKAATRGDAASLTTRIRGALAQLGDADAAEAVTREARGAAARPAGDAPCPADEDDVRTAALNALLQMNSQQAVPVLKQVLARRDPCSAPLREKALFLLSQQRTPETEALLLSVARQDPSPEVREKAVFWLSQVPTDRAVDVLQQILASSGDEGVREKALFALSQHSGARAAQLLRGAAEDASLPADLREKAIFWIGQSPSAESASFLRSLYGRLGSEELREKVLFSLSQMSGQGNDRWLLDVALNEREPVELRKKAIFWAGQAGVSATELGGLFDRIQDREVREQIVFALSQQGDRAAVDRLIAIARTERDPELRKKAIFWLGQSSDPRAAQVIAEIIGN